MFGDLDWPLNASRGLSAIAEFLVFTFQYCINLCWKLLWSVCVLHRPETFGRKHSLVAHLRQNNLSIQSTDTRWPGRVNGSKSVWVGSSWCTGQRFRPSSIFELEMCCSIVHTLHMHCGDGSSLTNAKNKNKINKLQEAQLMLTTGSTRLAVSRGQQIWYHSTCYI